MTFSGFATQLHINCIHNSNRAVNWQCEILQIQILLKFLKLQPSLINNSIAKCSLSAPGIQELPLLAASSYETAPRAYKPWQLSHELPRRREEGHPSHLYNIYSEKQGREQPRNFTCLKVEQYYKERVKDPHSCRQQKTTDCTGIPIVKACTGTGTQMNTAKRKGMQSLTDILPQKLYKTLLNYI